MSIHTFEDMKSHRGHKLECVTYGDYKYPVNTAIECVTCGMVLIDLSPNQTIGVDNNDGKTINWRWSYEDVRERAKERDIHLSEQQCIDILADVDHYKDASIGISWDTLDAYTDMYLEEESG